MATTLKRLARLFGFPKDATVAYYRDVSLVLLSVIAFMGVFFAVADWTSITAPLLRVVIWMSVAAISLFLLGNKRIVAFLAFSLIMTSRAVFVFAVTREILAFAAGILFGTITIFLFKVLKKMSTT